MVPFESLGAVFVSPSIVTMALSCIIYEIERGIFSYPLAFDDPVRGGGFPVGILPSRLVWENQNGGSTQMVQKL